MRHSPFHRLVLAALLAALLAGQPVHALVSFNDSKNRLDLVASANFGWDSNVFANATSGGDYLFTAGLGLDFKRRAGLIAINASAGIDATSFVDNSSQNSLNPRFSTELSKQTGRTTGALTLGAARQNRADSATNLRSESWSYDAGLNFKYPVIERYSLAGSLGYAKLDYLNNSALVDLETFSASVDLFYVYTSERDIFTGYRYRHGDSSSASSFSDHAFSVGLSGKILAKVAGNIRVGYQFRKTTGTNSDDHESVNASAGVTWNASKRINVSTQVAKDFSTTATGINMDSLSANLDTQYALNSKIAFFTGLGYGTNRFLGALGADRRDTFFTWSAGGSYSMNDHLKIALNYAYFRNWSTLEYSDFERNSVNLNLSSRF